MKSQVASVSGKSGHKIEHLGAKGAPLDDPFTSSILLIGILNIDLIGEVFNLDLVASVPIPTRSLTVEFLRVPFESVTRLEGERG